MGLVPYAVVWGFLALVVLGLALARFLAALHEDDNLHLAASEQAMIPRQLAFFQKLDKIDRWGKTLTVITVAGGLLLAAAYIYQLMQAHTQIG
jgi:hypothetical protein